MRSKAFTFFKKKNHEISAILLLEMDESFNSFILEFRNAIGDHNYNTSVGKQVAGIFLIKK